MIKNVEPDPFSQLRRQMVDGQLRARNITDPHVLQAMATLPRERFVPPDKHAEAYEDRALAIGLDQTISQPYMVALMTEKLQIQPEHRVLEIGTGSGYQTAVLARLAKKVYTVERISELSQRARDILDRLDIDNVMYRVGDGTLGWSEHAPFDRILVTAGSPEVPETLANQLIDGGVMVIPVGPSDCQTLMWVQKNGKTLRQLPIVSCRFVKLIGEQGWPKEGEEG